MFHSKTSGSSLQLEQPLLFMYQGKKKKIVNLICHFLLNTQTTDWALYESTFIWKPISNTWYTAQYIALKYITSHAHNTQLLAVQYHKDHHDLHGR